MDQGERQVQTFVTCQEQTGDKASLMRMYSKREHTVEAGLPVAMQTIRSPSFCIGGHLGIGGIRLCVQCTWFSSWIRERLSEEKAYSKT